MSDYLSKYTAFELAEIIRRDPRQSAKVASMLPRKLTELEIAFNRKMAKRNRARHAREVRRAKGKV